MDELAPHSEILVYAPEVNAAVVPGSNAFLPGEIPRRKCRGKSAEAIVVSSEPGAKKMPAKTRIPEDSMSRRAEPVGGSPTAWRGSNPFKPVGQGRFISPRWEAWEGSGVSERARFTSSVSRKASRLV